MSRVYTRGSVLVSDDSEGDKLNCESKSQRDEARAICIHNRVGFEERDSSRG